LYGRAIKLGATLIVALAIGGCMVSPEPVGDVMTSLQSTDPSLRARAAVKAGNNQDTRAIPLLIDRLEDPDPSVRMFAGTALRKITGEDMGWLFYESAHTRDTFVRGALRAADWVKGKKPGLYEMTDVLGL
jgi:HEAT repeat protein